MRFAALLVLATGCATAPESWPGPTRPFQGKVHAIPGTIEAEHYDLGPAGVAYQDKDDKNEGVAYREATGVDIEGRPDASNKHGIGWTRPGEWLVYTVDVKEAGTYTIEFPVACHEQGGTFRLEFGGVDKTDAITVPDTGGWTKLQTIRKEGVKLEAGRQVLRLVFATAGKRGSIGDIDLMRFTRQ